MRMRLGRREHRDLGLRRLEEDCEAAQPHCDINANLERNEGGEEEGDEHDEELELVGAEEEGKLPPFNEVEGGDDDDGSEL